jgi:hypothetical protein
MANDQTEVIPPSFNYLIEWASPLEKEAVLARMRTAGRQTMNFRTMPQAKLILLKDLDNDKKIIGWEGLDWKSNPRYPEVFSQFVEEAYRSFLLGVALSHACASILMHNGIENAFLRMEQATNDALLNIRANSKIYRILEANELNPEWVSNCQGCELFGVSCKSQAYLTYKVKDWVEFGNRRLGVPNLVTLPSRLILRKEIFRQNGRNSSARFQAKWVA